MTEMRSAIMAAGHNAAGNISSMNGAEVTRTHSTVAWSGTRSHQQ